MDLGELLAVLSARDIRLEPDGETLRVDAPKGALTPELTARIRESKPQLLALLSGEPSRIAARRDASRREFPLSLSQHAFFMLDQLQPGNSAYNIQSVRKVVGPLESSLLAPALEDVVDRHESLRTTFHLAEGGGVQRIHARPSCRPRFVDLSGSPTAERERQLDLAIRRRPAFRLDRSPLFEVELIRIAQHEHLFVLSMHHIISDAVSLDIFYGELLESYFARRDGRAASRPPLALQYADYAAWQQERLERSEFSSQLEYWRRELRSLPALLDRMTGGAESGGDAAASVTRTVPADVVSMVRRACQRYGVTASTVLLAAFQYVLHRYTESTDVPVIVPVSARNRVEIERLIGLFLNGLVIRTHVDGAMSTADLLEAVKQKTSLALAHRDLSVESLEGLFRARGYPEASLARLSRIGFNYLAIGPQAGRSMTAGDLAVDTVDVERTESVFELLLTATDAPEGLRLRLEYKTARFASAFAEGLLASVLGALQAMLQDDCGALGGLEWRSADEILAHTGISAREYESARPVTRRARELASLAPPGSGRRRVLGYTLDLPAGVSIADVEAAVRHLARHPRLRTTILRSPHQFLDREYDCVRREESFELAMGEDALSPAALARESGALADAFGARLWRAILADGGSGSRQLTFLCNEALLGPIGVHAHRLALLSRLGRSSEPIAEDVFDAAVGAERSIEDRTAAVPIEEAPALLTFLSRQLRTPRDDGTARIVIAGSDRAAVAECCAAHGVSADEYFQALYALLIATYARADAPFCFWSRTLQFDGAPRTGALRRVRSVPLPPDGDMSDLFASVRLDDASSLRVRNELEFLFEARHVRAQGESIVVASDGTVSLVVEVNDASVALTLACASAPFDAAGFLARMAAVSAQIAGGVTRPRDLSLLLPGEAASLAALNDTRRSYPSDTVVDLFARQAARSPERIAVSSAEGSITYRQLADQASRIAALLRARGAAGTVGICLSRSARLPAALLGVLQAGCSYVPLDPAYPRDRLQFALERTRAEWVLAERGTIGHVPSATRALLVDDLPEGDRSVFAPVRIDGSDLAYVMFTSGSSGQPKGVCVQHSALSNLLHSLAEAPGVTDSDVVCAITSPAFDISIAELLLPLCVGAHVVVATTEEARAVDRLARLLDRDGVTVLQATPTTWQMLVESGWRGRPALKALCGGEPLSRELAAQLLPRVGSLWNLYGPTETTVWSTIAQVRDGAAPVVSIGCPIANTSVHVLDACGRHVPPEVPGELYIGGEGVSAGYLDEPELTAERFVESRDLSGTAQRTYRTGDLVRIDPDGHLEFLRRLDRQVKVCGYRIEPQEIESCLREHPAISLAAVTLVESGSGPVLAAYYVASSDCSEQSLRAWVGERLPPYMAPQRWMALAALPRTPNGKIDYQALPSMRALPVAAAPAHDAIERTLLAIWSDVLGRTPSLDESFFEAGGHSLLLVRVHQRVVAELAADVPLVDLFTYPTIAQLAARIRRAGVEHATERPAERPGHQAVARRSAEPVAVVGLSARFPGSRDARAFWESLAAGRDAIRLLTDEELEREGVPAALSSDPRYVRAVSAIDGVECFDADFFRLSSRAATLVDPQIRLLLECAYEALEDAGYNPLAMRGRTGVFAGVGFNSYLVHNVLPNHDVLQQSSPLELLYANDRDYAASQVSYRLNLRGPSITVATACSTSLVAVHLACRSLMEGECDVALAGGVKIQVPQHVGYLHVDGGIFSRDGRCRPFDRDATGTIFGNGGGIVALKRLADAERDGDAIYAVVRGTAVNNDGMSKVGYTAPSATGQADVILEALRTAGVGADTLQYIEAHGTGTRLGDPVEVAALDTVFRRYTNRRGFCALGSVKGSIGHLDTAAGIAGFIKTVLALHAGKLPPAVHFEQPNPHLALADTAFFVNTALADWPAAAVRRAGVSSFGIGGTNAHAILEERPPAPAVADEGEAQLLISSARSEAALRRVAHDLAEHLDAHPDEDLADVAFTLQVGRPAMTVRAAVAGRSRTEAARALRVVAGAETAHTAPGEPRPLVFLFPGQGSEYAGMARELYASNPVFRRCFDQCADLVAAHAAWDLDETVFAIGDSALGLSQDTRRTQPALFAVEYALAQVLISWGLKPTAMIGHSLGEYVAACIANVFTLEQAMPLVLHRAELMASTRPGRMAAAFAPMDVVVPSLRGDCGIAAINAAAVTIVAGSSEAVDETLAALRRGGVRVAPMPGNRAFHSPLMDPVVVPLAAYAAQLTLRDPIVPIVSNVSGSWLEHAAKDPAYWGRHAREPVLFHDGLQHVLAEERATLVEVGPGRTMSQLARRALRGSGQLVTACLPGGDESVGLLQAAGTLWARGHAVDWDAFRDQKPRRRVHLPTYPFERKVHWIDAGPATSGSTSDLRRRAVDDWFSEPSWKAKRVEPATGVERPLGYTLLFADESDPLANLLEQSLTALGERVARARPGDAFACCGPSCFELPPDDAGAYRALVAALGGAGEIARSLHLWKDAATSFSSMLHLARAGGLARRAVPFCMAAVARNAYEISGEETTDPDAVLAVGPALVLPLEYPGVRCSLVDVDTASLHGNPAAVAQHIVGELRASLPESIVAFRGRKRWVRAYEPVRLPIPAVGFAAGVYVIVGGCGGIGYEVARAVAAVPGSALVLVGRTALDGESPQAAGVREKLERLRLGERVTYLQADVADPESLERVFREAEARYGGVRCVIHAAGMAGEGLAHFTTPERIDAVLAPKVGGARALADVSAAHGVSALVFFSSLAALAGDVGQVAYASANAFMDALAESGRRRGLPIYSIDWDTWADTGMARRAAVGGEAQAYLQMRLSLGIRSGEGIDALQRVLAGPPAQITVSVVPLADRLRARRPAASADEGSASLPRATDAGLPGGLTESESRLLGLWQQSFGTTAIGVTDDFFALGGSSLQAIDLVVRIQSLFNRDLDPNVLLRHGTIRAVAALLDGVAGAGDAPSLIVPLREGSGDLAPLALVHPVGGQLYHYRELVTRLRTRRPLHGIKAPPPAVLARLGTVEALAADYVRELRRVNPHGPYYLAGSSFGGTIAYEMAQQLTSEGAVVPLLALLDTPLGSEVTAAFETDAEILAYLSSPLGADPRLALPVLEAVPSGELPQYFLGVVRDRAPGEVPVDPESVRIIVDTFRENMRAMKAYRPRPYAGRCYFVKASARRHGVDPEHPERPWAALVGALDVVETPGDHFSMHAPPHVAALADALDRIIGSC